MSVISDPSSLAVSEPSLLDDGDMARVPLYNNNCAPSFSRVNSSRMFAVPTAGPNLHSERSSPSIELRLLRSCRSANCFNSLQHVQIELAHQIHTLNDYLQDTIQRQENKLRKRAFHDTLASEASLAQFRYPAQQNAMYSSFFQRNALPNISSVSTANDAFHPPPNKFSRLDDTFASGPGRGESFFRNNNSLFRRTDNSKLPTTLNPVQLHSSFLGGVIKNMSSFKANNSMSSRVNRNNSFDESAGEDQFSCVRVVSSSNAKKKLSQIREDEPEEASYRLSSNGPAAEQKEAAPSSNNETAASNEAKRNILLRDWTVILKDGGLYLQGNRLDGDKITAHTTEKIIRRNKDGCVATNNGLYQLVDPFKGNAEMPLKVKDYFKNKTFPLHWRVMLKLWIAESEKVSSMPQQSQEKNHSDSDGVIKACQVVLEKIDKTKPPNDENSNLESELERNYCGPKKGGRKPKQAKVIAKKCGGVKAKKSSISQQLEDKTEKSSSSKKNKQKKKVDKKAQCRNGESKKKTEKPVADEAAAALRNRPVDSGGRDIFGDLAMSDRSEGCATPTNFIRSVRGEGSTLCRSTPVLSLVNDLLPEEKNNSISIVETTNIKGNPVTKRFAKKAKKLRKKSKAEKPLGKDFYNMISSVKNKKNHILTTPKIIKEAFRPNNSNSDDSDIESDEFFKNMS